MFHKAARALKPHGQLVIVEQLAGKAPLLQGRIYAFDEIAHWFAEAGFRDVRRIDLLWGVGR